MRRGWEGRGAGRLLPLVAAVLAACAALAGAAWRGLPLPLDVAGVFLVIGAAAVAVSWTQPRRGALFVAALGAVVVAVLYGG